MFNRKDAKKTLSSRGFFYEPYKAYKVIEGFSFMPYMSYMVKTLKLCNFETLRLRAFVVNKYDNFKKINIHTAYFD